MKEVIMRFSNVHPDVELCIKRNKKIIFKKLSIDEVMMLINQCASQTIFSRKVNLLSQNIIGMGPGYTVIKQEGHIQYVTFNTTTYKIDFPNSIYVVKHDGKKIKSIQNYRYKKYEGGNTELYDYAMPNVLQGNMLCIGSADRTIRNNDIEGALNKIIATPYSHATFNGINGFSTTVAYFEYLEANPFPYKLLRKLNKKLKDVEV
jgi:hypothetical protein